MIQLLVIFCVLLSSLSLYAKQDTFSPSEIQLSRIDHFLNGDSPLLQPRDGAPQVIIHQHVHALTGDFFDHQVDLEMSPFGFNLERTYVSKDHTRGSLLHGWNHNHEDLLYIENRTNHRYAVTKGHLIGEHLYKGRFEVKSLRLDQKNFERGLTNCNGMGISGRTNALNHHLSKKNGEYVLKTGSGSKMHFKRVFKKDHFYQIVDQHTPSGHFYEYEYNNYWERLQHLSLKNGHQQQVAALTFEHPDKIELKHFAKKKVKGQKNPVIKVTASDGRSVKYTVAAFKGSADEEDLLDFRRFRIIKALRPNAPDETYEYSKARCCHPEQMIRKNRPDGRYLAIEYYEKGNDFSIDKVKALKGPSGTDSTPKTIYKFFYEKLSKESAKTVVEDGLGNRTIYYYNPKNSRPDTIEKLYGNSTYSLHSLEKFNWGKEEEGVPLLSREIYDNNRSLVFKRSYQYDKQGNVLKSTMEGNLTGKQLGESVSQTFTYSADGLNLTTSILDGNVLKEICYRPGTELVVAEFTKAGPYSTRVFYDYDENNALSLIISDDGTGRESGDLTGVTERQIQRMENTKSGVVGLPHITQSSYLDLSTQTEILLKKQVSHYDSWGLCIGEELYDSNHQLVYTTRSEYNNYGLKTLEVDPLGIETRYTYDLNGNRLNEFRPQDNHQKIFTYDLQNRLIKTEISDGKNNFVTTSEFDMMGNRIGSCDEYGHHTRYQYDSQGQLCTIIHPETLNSDGEVSVKKEFREYNSLGHLWLTVDGNGNRTYTYSTARGLPYLIEHPDGGTESFEYSLTGNLIRYISKNGTILCTDYDELSRPIVESTYAPSGELIQVTQKKYNTLHLIEEIDARGVSTYYEYDGAGRLVKTRRGETVQTIEYDTLGRKFIVKEGVGTEATIKVSHYDPLNQIIREEVFSGVGEKQSHQEFEYNNDHLCTVIKTLHQNGMSVHRTEYNAIGQVTKEIDPLGNTTHIVHEVAQFSGRSLHRVTTIDPLGRQKIHTYNERDELLSEEFKNAYGQLLKKTTFEFDRAGNKIARRDFVISPFEESKEILTKWAYDSMNRLTATSQYLESGEVRTLKREYSLDGSLAKITKADGVTIHYEYDSLGRIIHYYSSEGSVDYTYEYDEGSLPVQINDRINKTATTRNYNQTGRVTRETLGNGLNLSYSYNSRDLIHVMTYPDATQVAYDYEGIHLKGVKRQNALGDPLYTHQYLAYDLSGNPLSSELINGCGEISYQYDLCNRVVGIKTPAWEEKKLLYDPVGNLIERKRNEQILSYAYDGLNQLETEAGFVKNSYQNDSMHNQVIVNGLKREFNHVHELQKRYEYDRNGNVTRKDDLNFEYDALNRMTKVISKHGIVEYCYDSFHRRLTKKLNGTIVEKYFYSGQSELGATDGEGVVQQARVLGNQPYAEIGAAVAIELQGTVYVPLHDMQGNLVTLLDGTTGEIAEAYEYSAYGQQLTEGKLSPWRCASKRVDGETGFVDFGRRFYDPEELRWTSQDPILLSEGSNRYNYLENNPFRYVDPDGRMVFGIPLFYFGVAGMTVAVTTTEVAIVGVAAAACCTSAYMAEQHGTSIRLFDNYHFKYKPREWGYQTERYERISYLDKPIDIYPLNLPKSSDTLINEPNTAPGDISSPNSNDKSPERKNNPDENNEPPYFPDPNLFVRKKNRRHSLPNTVQNRQADDAKREIEKKLNRKLSQDEHNKFHNHVTGQGYNYQELVEEGFWLFYEHR